jgi:CrcB protein
MKGLEIILLLIGGMLGVLIRYRLVESPTSIGPLPLNVLLINVVGSFILGAFSVVSVAMNLDKSYALLVAFGFCGAFTTMSSFALETVNLIDDRQLVLGGVNILLNVGLSLGGVFAGRSIVDILLEWGVR